MEYVVTRETRHRVLYHLFAAYIADGAIMTIFGALLPYLIEENNLNYTLAGGLLSCLAIGNLLASLYYPVAARYWHQRRIIVTVTLLVPFILLLFTRVTSIYIMYVLILYLGFVKGNITITNAQLCNTSTHSSTRYQNIMHCTFAVGAFSSPFIMSMLMMVGFGWRTILYILAVASLVIIAAFWTADYSCLEPASDIVAPAGRAAGSGSAVAEPASNGSSVSASRTEAPANRAAGPGSAKAGESGSGWLSVDFVLMCLLLFVYLGIENVAQGWFVTYFQDTGIMSETLSTLMVSVTWVMIMLGRLFIATFCASRNKFSIILILFGGIFISSFLMIMAHSAAVATLSVAIIGLFMSGCYPTTFAAAGPLMGTNAMAMSIFTAVAALGGIIIPEIVGILGDNIGIASAMILFVFMAALAFAITVLMLLRHGVSRQ